MPFIRGRYHINPVLGEALEAAREAEAALLALEQEARQNGEAGADASGPASAASAGTSHPNGPIHRVEIEAAEVVPAHSGRAARGYVAQVHRGPAAGGDGDPFGEFGGSAPARPPQANGANAPAVQAVRARGLAPARPETHVFSDHRDLLSFLRDELTPGRARQR